MPKSRNEYQRGELHRRDLNPDPIAQFEHWMREAVQAGAPEPTAMSLATLDAEGFPRVRMVLLKGMDARGFVFFTNLCSRKGNELAAHPQACLLFPWVVMERQVIVRGRVERVTCQEAVDYFASRPRRSQLAAWASPQSKPAASREALEAGLREMEERFAGQDVPLPPFWGGFRVQRTGSSFGRAVATGCMTGSSTGWARAARGRWSGSRHDDAQPGP